MRRRIGSLTFATILAITPAVATFPGGNGKIVFESKADGNFEIYVMDPDGANLERLTDNSAVDRYPSWSPDGTLIAFQSDRGGSFDIWVMEANGTGLAQVTSDPAAEIQPAWDSTGNWIAFAKSNDQGKREICVVGAGGGTATCLPDPEGDNLHPAWSPVAPVVAFQSDRDDNIEIYVQKVDGSPQRLTDDVGGDTAPSWSPDGTRLAFASTRTGTATRLWTMDAANGSSPEEVPGTTDGDFDAAWSPDGTMLVFARTGSGGGSEIWVAGTDGSNPTQLTARGDQNQAPEWAAIEEPPPPPDNQRPEAEAGPDGTAECATAEGAMIHLDGSQSSDPDSALGTNDDIAVFEWFLFYGTSEEHLLGSGMTLDVLLPQGQHSITLRVTDTRGLQSTDTVAWTVVDPVNPAIEAIVSPSTLWPPDHRMVAVKADVTAAAGLCSPASRIALRSVTSNEPDDAHGEGDGHTRNDIQDAAAGTEDYEVLLRAERQGGGSGRIYTLTYAIVEGHGEGLTSSIHVTVPHDQRRAQPPTSVEGRAGGRRPSRSPGGSRGGKRG